MKLRLAHKGLLLVSMILALELSVLGSLFVLLVQTEAAALRADHTKKVTGLTNHIWQTLTTGAGTVNYVFNHMEDKAAMREFLDTVPATFSEMDKLKELTKNDDSASVGKLRIALATGRKGLKALSIIVRLLEQGNVLGARALDDAMTQRGMRLSQIHMRLTEEIHDAREEQLAIMKESPLIQSRSRMLIQLVMVGGIAANIIIAIVLLVLFARGITSRLQLVLDNTKLLTGELPLKPALQDFDEIGHLDRVFHDMADTLAEASRKERAVIENASDVICSLASDGLFLSVSPASSQVWGYASEELIGQTVFVLLCDGDHERYRAALREAVGATSLSLEIQLRRKDHALVDMLWSIRWHEGKQIFFCVAHDITERNKQAELLRKSEARVRSMFDNVGVGLMTVTDNGLIESVNSTAERMLMYDSVEMAQQSLSTLLTRGPQEAPSRFGKKGDVQTEMSFDSTVGKSSDMEFVQDILQRSQSRVLELGARTKDGAILPVEFSMRRFLSIEGERYLANIVDISERHELDRSKQEFVAMISHDLRTPLNSVQGYLELLGEGLYGDLPEGGEADASSAERNVVMVLRLVNDLLDIAKLDSGKLELHLENVALSTLLKRVQDAMHEGAEERHISVRLVTEETIDVRADAYRLERVLVSLLSHAIRTSVVGGSVSLSAECLQDYVTVKVQDSAPLIPTEQRDLMFERFRQARSEQGSDFSLAICKAIITEHGGSIGVTCEEGKGNVFWFRLSNASSSSSP